MFCVLAELISCVLCVVVCDYVCRVVATLISEIHMPQDATPECGFLQRQAWYGKRAVFIGSVWSQAYGIPHGMPWGTSHGIWPSMFEIPGLVMESIFVRHHTLYIRDNVLQAT